MNARSDAPPPSRNEASGTARDADSTGASTPAVTVDTADTVEVSFASVSEQDNIAYLLVEIASGSAVLVDAADRADLLRELVALADERAGRRGTPPVRLAGIVTTHRHWDHHRALAELSEPAGRAVWTAAGAADADELPIQVDRRLRNGDTVAVGGTELEVIELRGHTPGSVALALTVPGQAPRLFTGDSLFPGGVGNTEGDASRFQRLFSDVVERIFERFPDAAVVYPGHGAPTTLGAERPALPAWRARGW